MVGLNAFSWSLVLGHLGVAKVLLARAGGGLNFRRLVRWSPAKVGPVMPEMLWVEQAGDGKPFDYKEMEAAVDEEDEKERKKADLPQGGGAHYAGLDVKGEKMKKWAREEGEGERGSSVAGEEAGVSPLAVATFYRADAAVRFLLSADFAEALQVFRSAASLQCAATENLARVQETLGADALAEWALRICLGDRGNRTAFHYAARAGAADTIAFLARELQQRFARRCAGDGDQAAAAAAVVAARKAVLKVLSVKTKVTGQTALHTALHAGHAGAVRALVALGVDVDARQTCGLTALHLAARRNRGAPVRAFGAALRERSGEAAVLAAFSARSDPDQQTPLMIATAHNNDKAVHAILEVLGERAAAHTEGRDIAGNNAFHWAAECEQKGILDDVFTLGAVEAAASENASGATAMDIALERLGAALQENVKHRVATFTDEFRGISRGGRTAGEVASAQKTHYGTNKTKSDSPTEHEAGVAGRIATAVRGLPRVRVDRATVNLHVAAKAEKSVKESEERDDDIDRPAYHSRGEQEQEQEAFPLRGRHFVGRADR